MNLVPVGKKERSFLLNPLVLPSRNFDTSVDTVVEKFREAKAFSLAFKSWSEPILTQESWPIFKLIIRNKQRRLVSWLTLRLHVGVGGIGGQRELGKIRIVIQMRRYHFLSRLVSWIMRSGQRLLRELSLSSGPVTALQNLLDGTQRL